MSKEISDEVDALLRFYGGRKLILVADIKEFSRTYQVCREHMQDDIVFNESKDTKS